jgi:TrmH family RNA methyltransferase
MPSIARAKRLRALRRVKGRREHGMLLVEGPAVARDALDAGATVREALYTEAAAGDPAGARLLADLRAAGAEVEEVDEAELAEFADTVTPQGLLLVVDIPLRSLDDVAAPRLAVLDAVQDPGNVGTLIRAADALGAGGVALLPGTADPWNPKAVRAAAGASFRIPVVPTSVAELADWCRDRRVPLLAAAAGGDPAPRSAEVRDAALVFGNEAAGVSDEVRTAADGIVGIPQRGPADSLNVAMAGAILMDRFFGG